MSGSFRMRGARLAFVVGAALAAVVACYGPTEVRLDISTDLPCLAVKGPGAAPSGPVHTLVRLGGAVDAPIVADTTDCTDQAAGGFRDIGSIVLVPSGDRTARVTVQVSATADGSSPEACGRPETSPQAQAQCIVARRTFTFIEHASRALPIRLYAACRGQVCSATETCNKLGACESAVVDATGCTASDPTCQAPEPAPLPADGGSDAADATGTVDAADATPPHVPCTAADGTSVLVSGQAPSLLAVNRTRLFFVGASASLSSASVSWIDTTKPALAAFLFSVPLVRGSVTALAADDSAVWLGTTQEVYRYDLATGAQRDYPVASTAAIATASGAMPSPSSTPIFSAFAVTALIDPTTNKPGGDVYRLDPTSTAPLALFPNLPGTFIAASNAPTSAVFVFTPAAYGGPGMSGATPGNMPQPIKVNEPFGGLASDGASIFFGAATSIDRVDLATSSVKQSLYDVAVPGPVVVDATSVYFVQRGADVALFRGGRGGNDGPLLPAVRVATGYSDIQGLAADDACVYFWSASGLGAFSTLDVFPKTRVVPGASIPVHTP